MEPPGIVVLDLDGVVIKSNLIKYRVMLSLFAGVPERHEAISTFILANGGVPRRAKIAAILEAILDTVATPPLVSEYLARYAIELEHALATAPLVEGVAELLARSEHKFYLSSSAPEGEVGRQLARTGLLKYFSAVFGSDTPKANALREVKRRHLGSKPVFFGDSVGDLRAAQEARVAFVAVVNERDNFTDDEVIKITDFSSFQLVQTRIREALRQNAT